MRKGNTIGSTLWLGLLLVPGVLSVAGCGSSTDVIQEDPKAAAARLDSAKSMRSYFDRSNGNYDALSQADKDALNKLTGNEQNSRTAFSHMGPNATTAGSGGGLPPSGG